MQHYLSLVTILAFLLSTGCHLPAHMVWSPDGSKVAWRVGEQAFLLDDQGKPLAELGKGMAAFAWSKDSQTLYHVVAAENESAIVPTEIIPDWCDDTELDTAKGPSTQPTTSESPHYSVLRSIKGGEVKTLAALPFGAWYMVASSEGTWLAISGPGTQSDSEVFHVYLHHVESGKTWIISKTANMQLAFIDDNTLIYVQADKCKVTARMVAVRFDGVENVPTVLPLLNLTTELTGWIQAINHEAILFTAVDQKFPGPILDVDKDRSFKLFQYTFANSALSIVAENVGNLFTLSPDGKHILFERVTPAGESMPERHELAVMNVNGSDAHVLRDLSQYVQLPMWPAWRDAEHFAFVPAVTPENPAQPFGDLLTYEVMLYRISGEGEMQPQPVRKLSEIWDDAMKPFVKVSNPGRAPTIPHDTPDAP